MKLIINGRLVGLNEYTRACRSNRFAGAQMKKDMEDLIAWNIHSQLIPHVDGRVKLNFSWYEPNQKRDMDNIAFAKKFIQDALVQQGIINSDGWKGIAGFSDSFYVDKVQPRVEVEILEAK